MKIFWTKQLPSLTTIYSDHEIERALRTIVDDARFEEFRNRIDMQDGSLLSRYERLSILLYTKTYASFYRPINDGLRRGALDTHEHIFVQTLTRALQKLPPHDGVVTRGIRVPKDDRKHFVNNYGVGTRVLWLAFSSCSAQGGQIPASNIFFSIASITGRRLGVYADDELEREVIFLPNSSFDVSGVELHYDRAIIYLSEKPF